jgi:hypothetical protein
MSKPDTVYVVISTIDVHASQPYVSGVFKSLEAARLHVFKLQGSESNDWSETGSDRWIIGGPGDMEHLEIFESVVQDEPQK